MIDRFIGFIKKHALFEPDDTILLGVSGGVDSMVMASLFHKAGFPFAIAHCNFQLRGEKADRDERLTAEAAASFQVPYHFRRFDTTRYAQQNKISIEMAARTLRYDFFDETAEINRYSYIATAHHKGDVVETIIFNLARGTGISGLRGMLPKRDRIIRPLLFTERDEIVRYARENLVDWREDASNLSLEYQRNLIRHGVTPELLKINEGLFQTLEKTTYRLQAAEHYYYKYIEQIEKEVLSREGKDVFISKEGIKNIAFSAAALFELVGKFGFNLDQCEDMIGSLDQTGAIFRSSSSQLNVDRDFLIVSPLEEAPSRIEFFAEENEVAYGDMLLELSLHDASDYRISGDKNIAALDFDQLAFPLCLRRWNKGDRFVPLGMSNKKKLSDFMIDEKIPVNLKKRIPVLLSKNEIVWVVGHRIDNRFKINPKTKKVFQLVVKEND